MRLDIRRGLHKAPSGLAEVRHAQALDSADEPRRGETTGPRSTVRGFVLVMVGLTAAIVAFFAAYSSAFGDPGAHHIPVAVAAPPTVLGKLEASPALLVHHVSDLAGGREMVEDRTAYGALAVDGTGPVTLLVASGDGRSVEAILTQVGQQVAGARGTTLRSMDIAPTSSDDPNGSVEFYCVVFLGIGGALGATVLGRIHGQVRSRRDALRRLELAVVYTAMLSVTVTLLADIALGALAGHLGLLFLSLWMYTLAVCLAVTGLASLAGQLTSFVLIGLLVAFGNTSSGGAVPRPLLNGFFSALNPLLPQGAALSVLRGVQYFGDRGTAAGLLCLSIWGVAGLVLLAAAGLRKSSDRPAWLGSAAAVGA
jgi:hypothetical protein